MRIVDRKNKIVLDIDLDDPISIQAALRTIISQQSSSYKTDVTYTKFYKIHKVRCIKWLRNYLNLGLKDSKALYENLIEAAENQFEPK